MSRVLPVERHDVEVFGVGQAASSSNSAPDHAIAGRYFDISW